MFYSHELLSKRGPLGTIWLAGVYLRKLSKHAVLSSDLSLMCSNVEQPPVPLALPTQSTLLKGVVNIENKKAHYLLGPTNSAQQRTAAAQRLTEERADLSSAWICLWVLQRALCWLPARLECLLPTVPLCPPLVCALVPTPSHWRRVERLLWTTCCSSATWRLCCP